MKYFGYYADSTRLDKEKCALAAINKMDYIADVIANVAGSTEIISFLSRCGGTQKSERIELRNGVSVKYFDLKSNKNRILRVVSRFFGKLKLLLWIIKNVDNDEPVIVYHSLGYFNVINLAHKLKKFKLIYEVEEIFADVIGNKRLRKHEIKILKSADAYIFPTKLLSDLINESRKPEVLIHGTYKVEHNREVSFNDGKIHIVYAGTFDPRKGGALAAVSAAELLSSKHHIHIIGFGGDEDIKNIKERIDEVSKISKANITYDGLLSGEEYVKFIQSCDIGLSTQNPDAAFNDTSFPSKILSYMANGLRVVTVRIPAIESSAVGRDVYYYDEQTPQAIAEAIMKIDLNDGYDGRKRIKELDIQYKEDMTRLLGGKNAKYI